MPNYYSNGPMGLGGYYPQYGALPTGYQMPYSQPVQQPAPQPVSQPVGGAIGFAVDDPAQIRASDVPMNVEYVLFPKKDGSAVYKKFWNSQGELKTAEYVLKEELFSSQPAKPDPFIQINDRLARIEETLSSWSK